MTTREVRLQAAVVHAGRILLLHVTLDDGRAFWLLPGGGREPEDRDDAATITRELAEEVGLPVTVEALLSHVAAHPDDTTYRFYRTFLCRPASHVDTVVGTRDGIAVIDHVLWCSLADEAEWDVNIVTDRFLAPQLRAIRHDLSALPDSQ